MRRIELDFQTPVERSRRIAGGALLLIGGALLVEMGMSYVRLQHERAEIIHEVQTSKLSLDISNKEPADQKFTDKDFEVARQIVDRLSTPWDSFFAGLESVSTENVAILSIQPDIQTGLLHIEGEAKDYAAVLTLVAQLRVIKPFSEVFLLHHEIKRDDPLHPVGFSLSMYWIRPS